MAKCNSVALANGSKGGPVSVASTLKEGAMRAPAYAPGDGSKPPPK